MARLMKSWRGTSALAEDALRALGRASSGPAWSGPACFGLAVLSALSPTAASAQPERRERAAFEYARRRTISEGTGSLEGYTEVRVESGTYALETLTSQSGARTMFVDVERSWRDQSGAACRAGTNRARAEVDLETRLYRGPTELEAGPSEGAGVWLWAPPTVAAGATLRVLDHEPEAERGAVLDVGNATVPAILAEVSGEGTREAPAGFAGDAGLFRTRWSLSLWFDERTGHILRSERWEVAESEIAGFEEHDVLWVTDAPYLPERAQSAALPTHDCALETTPRAPTFVRLGVPIGALSIMLAALVVARRRASEERR